MVSRNFVVPSVSRNLEAPSLMHILTNAAPIPLGRHGTLAPGEWVVHDINAGELMAMAPRGTARANSVGNQFSTKAGGDNLLIMRSGAIGDLLYLSPILKEWQLVNPTKRLALSCFPKWHEVMCDTGVRLLPYPLSTDEAKKWDVVVSLEDTIETHYDRHATDALNDGMGVLAVPIDDYKPAFVVNELEKAFAESLYPSLYNRVRVGIQPRANVANRDYPLDKWWEVMGELITKHNCEVFLFGNKGQLPATPKMVPTSSCISTW